MFLNNNWGRDAWKIKEIDKVFVIGVGFPTSFSLNGSDTCGHYLDLGGSWCVVPPEYFLCGNSVDGKFWSCWVVAFVVLF